MLRQDFDLAGWLRAIGLERYAQAFCDAELTPEVLSELTDTDLKELGLPLGPRKTVLRAIRALAGSPVTARAPRDDPRALSVSQPERRPLTVMFVDLVGSTQLSRRLDPEDMQSLLAAYHNTVATEIVRLEGHVAKLMGDGVLAYFGWPRAHEDEAERAVHAALAVVEKVAGLRSPDAGALAARVGIATGLVVVGEMVGLEEARERTVVGDTPNLAARLQQLAEPGGVLVAEGTLRLLGNAFEYIDVGSAQIKGFADPIRAFRIVRASHVHSRFESLRGATVAPLVGREQELALLLERSARAAVGEGQAVLLAGEPGVGKSRLVSALRDHVRGEGWPRLRYQCSPYHSASALHPVIAQLERAADFTREDDNDAKLRKLSHLLGDAHTLSLFANLLEIEPGSAPRTAGMTPQERKTTTFKALLAQLEKLAASGPVLLVLEDAHWIDPTTEELFSLIVERAAALPVLLIMTFRPEFRPPWTGHSHVTSLTLSRISRTAVAEIAQRVAGKLLPDTVLSEIIRRTDGVPLFVEELTKAVVESGLLRETSNGFELDGEAAPALVIPATLHDSLLARLDRLSPAKEVAQIGAVIGREFSHEILAAVTSLPTDHLAAALDELIAAELVFRHGLPPEATYVFKHALVQDAAYSTLLKSRRRDLHSRIAAAIEEQDRRLSGSGPEILAHHYAEAGQPAAAAAAYLSAGQLAKGRHAAKEATAHLELCLRLAEQAPSSEVRSHQRDAWLALGDLAGLADDLERANGCYDRALAFTDDESQRRGARNRQHRLRFTSRDGARLAFYEHGSGDPTIVFVNPIVYGLAIFQPILERLCQWFRVITVDCRGAGRSDPLVRPYGIKQHADDLQAIIEEAGAAPIVGVGISRGSNQLLHLANRHPELVAKLMIVGTPVVHHGATRSNFFNPEYLRRRSEAYAREDVDELLRTQAEFVYTEEHAAELQRMAIARRLTMSRETILSFYDPDPDLDVQPLLASISAPTLVAHGCEDRLNSFAAAEYLVARLPCARLYAFEGKGHSPMFTATEEFCSVLREFIDTGEAGWNESAAQVSAGVREAV